MNQFETVVSSQLEGIYGLFRKLQATHDGFETRCIGSGNCCKIGLRIHLSEAWNIARNIKRDYWITAEQFGIAYAQNKYEGVISDLKHALTDTTWDPMDEESTERKCAFFSEGLGCSIYEYRPLICRAYGVISPVQDGVCPRKRLADGGHELIPRDEQVTNALGAFDNVISGWGSALPDLDFSIHIAAGVLRFLLSEDQLKELIATTDAKFWTGKPGYPHQMNKTEFETAVQIERK